MGKINFKTCLGDLKNQSDEQIVGGREAQKGLCFPRRRYFQDGVQNKKSRERIGNLCSVQ